MSRVVFRAWDAVRGELVGLIGLIGEVLGEVAEAMQNWSIRHTFSRREQAEFAARLDAMFGTEEEER